MHPRESDSCPAADVLETFRKHFDCLACPWAGMMPVPCDDAEVACAAVLRALCGADDVSSAADAALRATRALKVEAPATLLEGLVRLGQLANAKQSALEALVVCSSISTKAWCRIIDARVAYVLEEFGETVANSILQGSEVAQKLLTISKEDCEDTPTPVVVALHALFDQGETAIEKQTMRKRPRHEIGDNTNKTTDNGRDAVSMLDSCATNAKGAAAVETSEKAVDENVETRSDGEVESSSSSSSSSSRSSSSSSCTSSSDDDSVENSKRTRLLFAIPFQAWVQVPRSLLISVVEALYTEDAINLVNRTALSTALKRVFVTSTPFTTRLHNILGTLCPLNCTPTTTESLDVTFKCAIESDDVVSILKRHMSSNRYDLAAAAYLAQPHQITLKHAKLARAIYALPSSMRGPIDDTIDKSVRSILSSVQAFTSIYKHKLWHRGVQENRKAGLCLQRLSILEPWLLARRFNDLSATLIVLVDGQGESQMRYETNSMYAIQVLSHILYKCTQATSLRPDPIISAALRVWTFLLDEQRCHYGIPSMFSQIASSILQILIIFHDRQVVREQITVLTAVHNAKGTDEAVKAVLVALLDKLNA